MLAIVDGIESFAINGRNHLSIQCDCCKTIYNGGNGSTKAGPIKPVGYRGDEYNAIRADARSIGWTGPMTKNSDIDLCPVCSKKAFGGTKSLLVVPRMDSVRVTQWFKHGDHPDAEFSFGNAFIETYSPEGSTGHKYILPGNYIVESANTRVVMTAEEVAANFVLASTSDVFK